MKRMMMVAVCAAAMIGESAAGDVQRDEGRLAVMELRGGENPVASPARTVALQAISTNASGTVTLKKVTRLNLEWEEVRTVTNETYATAWSNLTHTVTNAIVSAWRTNAVVTVATNGTTNIVVTTNFLAKAQNAAPATYPYPDLMLTTNLVAETVVYTNVPYQAVVGQNVMTLAIPMRATKEVTNDLMSVTLSGGFAATNMAESVLAPGDIICASGTAFSGGRVQLIVDR